MEKARQSPIPEIRVENLVYTCHIGTLLNLAYVARCLKKRGAAYNPNKFAAVILRFHNSVRYQVHRRNSEQKDTNSRKCRAVDHIRYHISVSLQNQFHRNCKIAILIFSTGKIVCTGAKQSAQARYIINFVKKDIHEIGYKTASLTPLNIENLVGSIRLPGKINLALFAKTYSSFCSYDPQLFPGVITRYPEIKPMTILVFNSGKLVITGARSEINANEGFKKVYHLIRKFDTRNSLVDSSEITRNPYCRPIKEANEKVAKYVDELNHKSYMETLVKNEKEKEKEKAKAAVKSKFITKTILPPVSFKDKKITFPDKQTLIDRVNTCLLEMTKELKNEMILNKIKVVFAEKFIEEITLQTSLKELLFLFDSIWGGMKDSESRLTIKIPMEAITSKLKECISENLI